MKHEISVNKDDTLLISFSDGSLSVELTANELKQKLSASESTREGYQPKGMPDAKEEIKKSKK